MIKNIIEKISKVKVDSFYDLPAECIPEIIQYSKGDIVRIIYNSFLAGYMQGRKSAFAKIKKK